MTSPEPNVGMLGEFNLGDLGPLGKRGLRSSWKTRFRPNGYATSTRPSSRRRRHSESRKPANAYGRDTAAATSATRPDPGRRDEQPTATSALVNRCMSRNPLHMAPPGAHVVAGATQTTSGRCPGRNASSGGVERAASKRLQVPAAATSNEQPRSGDRQTPVDATSGTLATTCRLQAPAAAASNEQPHSGDARTSRARVAPPLGRTRAGNLQDRRQQHWPPGILGPRYASGCTGGV